MWDCVLGYVFAVLVEILWSDVNFVIPSDGISEDMSLRKEKPILQRFKRFVVKNFMAVKVFYAAIFKPETQNVIISDFDSIYDPFRIWHDYIRGLDE